MVLSERTYRFAELRRTIGGVSERMLAQTLQWLEHDGLVAAGGARRGATACRVQLDAAGRDASRQVLGLTDWIESHMPQMMEARSRHAAAAPKRELPADPGHGRRTAAARAAGKH